MNEMKRGRYQLLNDHGSIIIVHMIIVFSSLAIYFNSISGVHQHFVYMAKSFLQGKLYLVEMPGNWFDAVKYDNINSLR